MQSRREFLIRASEFAPAGMLAMAAPRRLLANALGQPIQLQLYTVGAQLDQDFDGTLKQVAAIGYKQVKLAGSHGRKPAEVKKSLAAAGLHCSSVHIGVGGLQFGYHNHNFEFKPYA